MSGNGTAGRGSCSAHPCPLVVGLGSSQWFWAADAKAEMVKTAKESGVCIQGTDIRGLMFSHWGLNQGDNLHADLHIVCMFSFKINVPFSFQCLLLAHP